MFAPTLGPASPARASGSAPSIRVLAEPTPDCGSAAWQHENRWPGRGDQNSATKWPFSAGQQLRRMSSACALPYLSSDPGMADVLVALGRLHRRRPSRKAADGGCHIELDRNRADERADCSRAWLVGNNRSSDLCKHGSVLVLSLASAPQRETRALGAECLFMIAITDGAKARLNRVARCSTWSADTAWLS
jgi:hypothetical protein